MSGISIETILQYIYFCRTKNAQLDSYFKNCMKSIVSQFSNTIDVKFNFLLSFLTLMYHLHPLFAGWNLLLLLTESFGFDF